jgi:hypothetical protein
VHRGENARRFGEADDDDRVRAGLDDRVDLGVEALGVDGVGEELVDGAAVGLVVLLERLGQTDSVALLAVEGRGGVVTVLEHDGGAHAALEEV